VAAGGTDAHPQSLRRWPFRPSEGG
jgi:hypothetical protein